MRILLILITLGLTAPTWAGQTVVTVPHSAIATISAQIADGGTRTVTVYHDVPQIGSPLPVALTATVPALQALGGSATVIDYDRHLGSNDGTFEILVENSGGTASLADILLAIPGIKAAKRYEIRRGGQNRLQSVAAPYEPSERETWEQQINQSRLYLSDPQRFDADSGACRGELPMLSALAAGRGVSLATLAGWVLENNAAFQFASGAVLGRQQKCLDDLDRATTWEEFAALDCWAGFSLEVQP